MYEQGCQTEMNVDGMIRWIVAVISSDNLDANLDECKALESISVQVKFVSFASFLL